MCQAQLAAWWWARNPGSVAAATTPAIPRHVDVLDESASPPWRRPCLPSFRPASPRAPQVALPPTITGELLNVDPKVKELHEELERINKKLQVG